VNEITIDTSLLKDSIFGVVFTQAICLNINFSFIAVAMLCAWVLRQ
jgi:hypothetical protein